MTETIIQKAFRPLKNHFLIWLWSPIRSLLTGILTPISFSLRTGHFRSSFKRVAVSAKGEPIPWYTYPYLDFLSFRYYRDKRVLEFGGGQSTLWWAKRAKHVVVFEGDKDWYDNIKSHIPSNVDLYLVSMVGAVICDDAEAFSFYDGFKDSGLSRVDFFGYAPCVVLPHCTSILFGNGSFLFDPNYQIQVIAKNNNDSVLNNVINK